MTPVPRRRWGEPATVAPPPDSLRARLHPRDPFDGFPTGVYATDLRGWDSTHPIFEQAILSVKPTTIIEVGSWKGASALHMAAVCRKHGLACEIVCVDTWLGSSEHKFSRGDEFDLRLRHGYPEIYYVFMSNVIESGLASYICPFPNTSENAHQTLKRLGVRAGIVYIDAAHHYAAVRNDLQMYWELLTEDGLVIGDDYEFDEVAPAARDFAESVGRPLEVHGKKYVIRRGATETPRGGAPPGGGREG
jgi:predicted O-methyltransferase YrrM